MKIILFPFQEQQQQQQQSVITDCNTVETNNLRKLFLSLNLASWKLYIK